MHLVKPLTMPTLRAGDKELTRALKQRFPKEGDTIDWWVEQLSVQDGIFEQLATTRVRGRNTQDQTSLWLTHHTMCHTAAAAVAGHVGL